MAGAVRKTMIEMIVETIDSGLCAGPEGSKPFLSFDTKSLLKRQINELCDELVREAIEP